MDDTFSMDLIDSEIVKKYSHMCEGRDCSYTIEKYTVKKDEIIVSLKPL